MIREIRRAVPRSGALAILVAVACGRDADPPRTETGAATAAATAPTLEAATALGVPNARMPLPGIVAAGQITQAQLDGLVAAGYHTFVSLRPAAEAGAGWEESYLGSGSGSPSFVRIPVAGAQDLTRAAVEGLDRLLERAGEGTVVYCGSGNRVGALLALRARWLEGATAEEALELGRSAGMTRLEPAVAALLEPAGG